MMSPASHDLDIPAEITERRSPQRIVEDWWRQYAAECPQADGCVANEAELLEMLGGEDPEWVVRREAQSLTPSSGESGDRGPAGAQ